MVAIGAHLETVQTESDREHTRPRDLRAEPAPSAHSCGPPHEKSPRGMPPGGPAKDTAHSGSTRDPHSTARRATESTPHAETPAAPADTHPASTPPTARHRGPCWANALGGKRGRESRKFDKPCN